MAFAETLTHGIEFIDPSGTITFVNSALHEMYECCDGELTGKTIYDFLLRDEHEELCAYF